MIELRHEHDVAALRDAIRELASARGMRRVTAETLANVASELGHNALDHAGSGTAHLDVVERSGVLGIALEVWDRGPGIADPTAAFSGTGGSATGLGMGLAAARRLSDEFDIDTRLHEGTRIRARKFDGPVAGWPQFALFGRPHPQEQVSGDDALIQPSGTEVVFAVADGLGHGPDARESARRTVDAIRAEVHGDLTAMLAAAHVSTVGARGTAATVGRFGFLADEVHLIGIGNVVAQLHGPGGKRRQVLPRAGVLGGNPKPRLPTPTLLERARGDVLILFSDGLGSNTEVDEALLRQPAIVIAHQLVERFWRERDDVTVLVVK